MPCDTCGHYWVKGNFQSHIVSRMSSHNCSCAWGTTQFSPTPYPSTNSIITHMDDEGNNWYHDMGTDLHLRDFIFQVRIQSARRMSQWAVHFPTWDRVLE